jgi:polysaccharide export outer membrane protein
MNLFSHHLLNNFHPSPCAPFEGRGLAKRWGRVLRRERDGIFPLTFRLISSLLRMNSALRIILIEDPGWYMMCMKSRGFERDEKERRMNAMPRSFQGCLVLLIAAIGIASCGHHEAVNRSETPRVAATSYILGPKDLIGILVWREPEFSRQVLVRPDGKISFPLLDDIEAEGLTTLHLKAVLTERLKNIIDDPEVTVILLESHSKNLYIIGKVKQPGTYPLAPGMTVLQALSVAGGLEQWADEDGIRIIRVSEGKEELFKFDYGKVIKGKELDQNILLMPNDTIVVP